MRATTATATLPRIQQLWVAPDASVNPMATGHLADAYGASLTFPSRPDRPTVIVNFVSTLDGVVSYATAEAAGGGEISGFSAPDRFVMGLLRAHADAVMVGAGTVRAAPAEDWTPASIYPDAAGDFGALRREMALAPEPTTVVVTASGDVDPTHPGLRDPAIPVLIITTRAGLHRCATLASASNVTVTVAGAERVAPHDLLVVLRDAGFRLITCEGGPHLLAELLAADVVDELFLTIAPQIAGRSADHPRLALAEGVAFDVAAAPWWTPVSFARSGGHLFTRYRRAAGAAPKEAAQ